MNLIDTPAAAAHPRKASLFGRALAGFGSVIDVLREAQEMRADFQRRFPNIGR